MRVMLDTNVILSLAIFRSRTIQAVFDDIYPRRIRRAIRAIGLPCGPCGAA